jgi:predicted peptidase
MLQITGNLAFLLCLVAGNSETPVQQPAIVRREVGNDDVPATANRGYQLFVPKSEDLENKLPLIVYLHGAGSKGDDNRKPASEPLAAWLTSKEVQGKHPCFVLIPQCRSGDDSQGRPHNWVKWEDQGLKPPAEWLVSDAEPSDQLRASMAILDIVAQDNPIDEERIYLAGMSMGGSGAWDWAAREPKRFAAVVPVCGLSDIRRADSLRELPIWAFHGEKDEIAPVERTKRMMEKLAGYEQAKFTEFGGAGHNIARSVIQEKALLEWLFAQRKGAKP